MQKDKTKGMFTLALEILPPLIGWCVVSALLVTDTVGCLPNSYLPPIPQQRPYFCFPACQLSKPLLVIIRGPANEKLRRWNPKLVNGN